MIIEDINGLKLYYLNVDKFTTSRFGIIFQTESDMKTALAEKIMCNLITKTSVSYPTEEEFNGYLQDLYSASIDGNSYYIGNTIISNYSSRFINDEYVNDNIDIFSSIVKLFNEIFTKPSFYQNNQFNELLINKEKQLAIDNFGYIENDDMLQAFFNILVDVYKNPITKNRFKRDKDLILNISNNDLLTSYNKIRNSQKIFYYIGNYDLEKVKETILNNWTLYNEEKYEINYKCNLFNETNEVVTKEVEKDNLQSLVYNVYKQEDENYFENSVVSNLFNKLISGRSSSDLFQEVREKYNYCYFINSATFDSNRLYIVYSGVFKENIIPTSNIIDKIFDNYKNGKFTSDHLTGLEAVKKELIGEFYKQLDKIGGYLMFILESILRGKIYSLDEEISKINNVTLNDISNYAKGYQKVMNYYVVGKDGNGNE